MNGYELTVVLPGKTKAAKKKTVSEKIEKLVKTAGGRVDKTDDWGEIDLAYKIKKEATGLFLQFLIELKGSEVKSLPDKLRLESDIIRYLIVKKE